MPRPKYSPTYSWIASLPLVLIVIASGWSDRSAIAGPADSLAALEATLRPGPDLAGATAARSTWSERGHLRYLGAPQGSAFAVPGGDGPQRQDAERFVEIHRRLLGLEGPAALVTLRDRERAGRRFVVFEQTWSGVPVFGARAIVQLGRDGIEALIADLATDAAALAGVTSIPVLGESQALAHAMAWATARAPGEGIETRAPRLAVFAPEVLGSGGPPRLVWDVSLAATGRSGVSARLLIDATHGALVREYPLERTALDRDIYDANNFLQWNGDLVRSEGQPPCGIAEADWTYDRVGETRQFFAAHHGRDGIDGAGATLNATVRFCALDDPCPWSNASWNSFWQFMRFGQGWTQDDIVGHEYTHGVTEHESGLIYENASGAMDESFADIWGEFVDLGNGIGNDGSGVRWDIGEDLAQGALRDMSDPPSLGDPDRLGSGLYVPWEPNPQPGNDYGGVHTNSGVNNKLCVLLTDGGSFNGQSIYGKGVAAVADLYYEVNTHLLPAAADWVDLSNALRQAAINLGWTQADRDNLDRACVAVEIGVFTVDGASLCSQTGAPVCGPASGPYRTVSGGLTAVPAGARITIRAGTYPEILTTSKRSRLEAAGGVVRLGPP